MFQTYSQVRNRASASSTGWALLVSASTGGHFTLTLIVSDALFYDVYTHVSELHLAEIGMDVEWSDVDVLENSAERWGNTREYFSRRFYRLPVAKMRAL